MNAKEPTTIQDVATQLYGACRQLLECPDLNLDELEEYTIASIQRAEAALKLAEANGITPAEQDS